MHKIEHYAPPYLLPSTIPASAGGQGGSPGREREGIRINRYICIHGHFYQPPRENPWLEEIETEDTAYPYHDWNERITAECYAPNASSRILGPDKSITDIVNNYSRISFNFGPTLLSWLERHNQEVYGAILDADREGMKRFSGHGCAIAQVYNHLIMPLASTRDRRAQILWGIRDFTTRFNRMPEGMWLSETAVDEETLDIMAGEGIRFTILDPNQAAEIRPDPQSPWTPVSGGRFEIGLPYRCTLPSGRTIAIFFYDHAIANEIAFGELLTSGELFADRMMQALPPGPPSPRILSVATDGETYGHHHRFADMALAYALHLVQKRDIAGITIFGEFLEKHPPVREVRIREQTSWSCPHGIGRWQEDCGCRTYHACLISNPAHCLLPEGSDKPGRDPRTWNQQWRRPLRDAMNWLNDSLTHLYQERATGLFQDPEKAREEYYDLFRDRSDENIRWFFSRHGVNGTGDDGVVTGLRLLEMERHALLMFTSCGWFFDDIGGIESVQVMMYACRAMQLAREISGTDPEPEFITRLSQARSNLPGLGTGADIYTTYVKTAAIDHARLAFHYAITSLIEPYPREARIHTYTICSQSHRQGEAGILRLVTGHAIFRSDQTRETSDLVYAAIHLGDYNFMGGIGEFSGDEAFTTMEEDLWDAFTRSDVPGMVLSLNRHFPSSSYSLWDLFKDGRKQVLYAILESTLADIESEYRQIHRRYFALIRAMKEMQIKPPEALEYPVRYILNHDIRDHLRDDPIDITRLQIAIEELIHGRYPPDLQDLNFHSTAAISWQMEKLSLDPEDIRQITTLNQIFSLIGRLGLRPELWDSQNRYFRIHSRLSDEMHRFAGEGDGEAAEWLREFARLGAFLGVVFP